MDAFLQKCIKEDNKIWGFFNNTDVAKLGPIETIIINNKVKTNRGYVSVYVDAFGKYIEITNKFIKSFNEKELAAFMTYRLNGKVKFLKGVKL